VLKAEKMDLRESQGFLKTGYEGAAMVRHWARALRRITRRQPAQPSVWDLASGLIGMAADAMVEDINYTMVTDLQISEHSKATVTTDNIAALKQGTSGVKVQTSTEQGNRAKYQTRVVSNANKVNLKFKRRSPFWKLSWQNLLPGLCNFQGGFSRPDFRS
jgi:hypothetical protein